MTDFTDLDLSTAVLPHDYAQYADGVIKANDPPRWPDWIFPGFVLDPVTTYEIQFEFTDDGSYSSGPYDPYREITMYSATGDTEADYDAAEFRMLGTAQPDPVSPCTLTVGPGLMEWADAVGDGDIYVMFEASLAMEISAVRWREVEAEPIGTDISNDLRGRRRGGLGLVFVTPPIAPPSPSEPTRVTKAVPLPVPTMDNGRPT